MLNRDDLDSSLPNWKQKTLNFNQDKLSSMYLKLLTFLD